MDLNYVLFIMVLLNLAAEAFIQVDRPGRSKPNKGLLALLAAGTIALNMFLPGKGGFIAGGIWLATVVLKRLTRGGNGRVSPKRPISPATLLLIAINASVYIVEFLSDTENSPVKLVELGALYTPLIQEGEWWRLISAQFLHFNALHLACNMLGLYILGPFVELNLGRILFVIAYILSGCGGMLIASAPFLLGWNSEADLLIGASAGVLGLVGITAGIILRAYFVFRDPKFLKQLRVIGQVILLQIIFDSLVPEVSSSAHMGGAVCGLFIGWILATVRSRKQM